MNRELIERFEALISSVKRDNIDSLLRAIRASDFYRAPASTRFHGAYEGGLLEHSLNVYDCLIAKKNNPVWAQVFKEQGYTQENFIIAALLHDMCKISFYEASTKNEKTYDPEIVAGADPKQVKSDEKGRFVWRTVPTYTVNDQYPLGHGAKSVMMIYETGLKLESCEKYAINWHMGAWDCAPGQLNTLSQAMEKKPLCLALQQADQEATYLLENEKK